jgi:hypothetical protein
MSNRMRAFKDRDVKRVIKAIRESGFEIARVEVNPRTGTIAAVVGKPGERDAKGALEDWMAKHADQIEGH